MNTLGLLAAGFISQAEANDSLMRPDGRDSFSTKVSGYMTTENPTAEEASWMDEGHLPAAFLTITDFADQRFHDQLMRLIGEGNTLNQVDGKGRVQFRLGCFENQQIVSESMSVPDQAALLQANSRTPVTIELTFKKGAIGGWECASFADGMKVIGPFQLSASDTAK